MVQPLIMPKRPKATSELPKKWIVSKIKCKRKPIYASYQRELVVLPSMEEPNTAAEPAQQNLVTVLVTIHCWVPRPWR